MSINRVTIVGNLGSDPEIKYLQSGTPVCKFSIATTDEWFDQQTGEKQSKTEWHKIVTWGKLAESCAKYLKKGKSALIEGKLQTRQFEDKESVNRTVTEVSANIVQFL